MASWDDDEEAREWRAKHKNYMKHGKWKTITVQLETRRKFVRITKEEWKTLQTFLSSYDSSEDPGETRLRYRHLPKKVIIVIEDWIHLLHGGEIKD